MSMTSQQYAALSDDVYKAPQEVGENSKAVNIGGVSYKRLEYVDSPSGYQAILYQRVDTGELIVAHRGTEGKRELGRDGVLADGGMVATRHNAQAADAIAFTRHALELAERQTKRDGHTPQVTVTGHSLGGNLAQVTAHEFGLKGETFNAYGAVSLDRRIGEGGHDVINHVMAGDPVSAASRHYGEVRMYATPQEVATLRHAGYANDRSVLDARNPASAMGALAGASHRLDNFLPVDVHGKPDRSVLQDPETVQLARQYTPMIDKYRGDVEALRVGVTLGARGWKGLVEDGFDKLRGPQAPGEGRSSIGVLSWSEQMQQLHGRRPIDIAPASPQGWHAPLKAPGEGVAASGGHPNDPLYLALKEKLSATLPAATVMHATVEAKREGMHSPEQIKAVHEHNGHIWIEGHTPGFRAHVETGAAVPPMQESLRQAQAMDEQRAQAERTTQQQVSARVQ